MLQTETLIADLFFSVLKFRTDCLPERIVFLVIFSILITKNESNFFVLSFPLVF